MPRNARVSPAKIQSQDSPCNTLTKSRCTASGMQPVTVIVTARSQSKPIYMQSRIQWRRKWLRIAILASMLSNCRTARDGDVVSTDRATRRGDAILGGCLPLDFAPLRSLPAANPLLIEENIMGRMYQKTCAWIDRGFRGDCHGGRGAGARGQGHRHARRAHRPGVLGRLEPGRQDPGDRRFR